jgi:hypothetical protein
MTNKNKTIIVTILLFVFMLGALSISEPMPVTGGEEPPTTYCPNGEVPVEYGPQFEEIILDLEEDLTANKTPDNQIMANDQIASYAALGFSTHNTVYYGEGDGCIENSENGVRIAFMNVVLPHGSRIHKIEFNGIDRNDTASMKLEFRRYYFKGNTSETLATLTSGDAFKDGYFYETKTIDHKVDNYWYNYLIGARFPEYNSLKAVAFCNAVIYYTPPSPFVNALPMISTNN